MPQSSPDPSTASRQLILGTISFAVCFTAWGLISAFAGIFRDLYQLSSTQLALLVSVPVLLGAVARVPMGMITDRFGGRTVFALLAIVVAVPVALVPMVSSYPALLVTGFFLGLAGSSFAVGVGFVSRWFPAARQGGALGVYGMGNIGQSVAVFLGPVVAAVAGWQGVFTGMSVLLVVWGVTFALLARNAPKKVAPKTLSGMLGLLLRQRMCWVLSAFYFLTFGGFVAFSIYLPTLLRDTFGLAPSDAGFRTAGFVVLATFCRPLGGWLADRVGGARVLNGVFLGIAPFAALLAWPSMIPFTVGALGCAALLGFGNGAVFKLVPERFPEETGTVTGLVGAMGGFGGFFPPLLLGVFRDSMGTVWPGFLLLAAASLVLARVNAVTLLPFDRAKEITLPPEMRRTADRLRAGARATLGTAILIGLIVVGSRNLQTFDPALVIYTFAVIFATWGVIYHYSVWLDKPPTRVYWERGWELFRAEGLLKAVPRLAALTGRQIVAQPFIRHRSTLRWVTHQLLFWGCIIAVAITFPLVFGWIYFRTPADQMTYVTYLFGFPVMSFQLETVIAWTLFHGLDIAAVLVIAGIALALWRRLRDQGPLAVQTFANDFFPLALLFAISITGLALTASQWWLEGEFYSFLSILHAITVIVALLYLPFGKFFHIFQRPAQLGVKLYQQAGEADEGARCASCGARFTSKLHIEDVKQVLPQLGFDYRVPGPAGTWQDLCPACKRKTLSRAQMRLRGVDAGGRNSLTTARRPPASGGGHG
jgi:NNP family nitrate/nitrite transporter-like MFS transporter